MVAQSAPEPRVYTEQDFRRLLAWEVQRATRYQDFLSLCLAQPDQPGAFSPDTLDAMARRVVEFLRATDVVALLGDRIAIIFVHTPESDAQVIAERVRGLLQTATFPRAPGAPAVTSVLSLGLASFPTDATSDTVLLDQAQARLTAARRGGDESRPLS